MADPVFLPPRRSSSMVASKTHRRGVGSVHRLTSWKSGTGMRVDGFKVRARSAPAFAPALFSLAEPWTAIRLALASWRDLDVDWDGDDAVAPTGEQIGAAEAFVRRAELAGVAQPRPYIAADGEFGFHWDGPLEASLSFLPNGRFVGFCDRADDDPVKIAGPLDVAAASATLFTALARLPVA